MVSIRVDFSIGDKVFHFTGVEGLVTAIHFRGREASYEMSYLGDSGPACVECMACELKADLGAKTFGFGDKELKKKAQ